MKSSSVSAVADRATRASPEPFGLGHSASVPNAGLEPLVYGLLQDAKLVGCASRQQLTPHIWWLYEAQDEIACAIQKAERQ